MNEKTVNLATNSIKTLNCVVQLRHVRNAFMIERRIKGGCAIERHLLFSVLRLGRLQWDSILFIPVIFYAVALACSRGRP